MQTRIWNRNCEKRRFKALLESRSAFWLRRGLESDIRACACNGIRSRSGLSLAGRSLTQSDAVARRGRCRLSAKMRHPRPYAPGRNFGSGPGSSNPEVAVSIPPALHEEAAFARAPKLFIKALPLGILRRAVLLVDFQARASPKWGREHWWAQRPGAFPGPDPRWHALGELEPLAKHVSGRRLYDLTRRGRVRESESYITPHAAPQRVATAVEAATMAD
jgi:hypothetical protein